MCQPQALRFGKIVEPVIAQQPIQLPIERMAPSCRQIRGPDPHRRLSIGFAFAHCHAAHCSTSFSNGIRPSVERLEGPRGRLADLEHRAIFMESPFGVREMTARIGFPFSKRVAASTSMSPSLRMPDRATGGKRPACTVPDSAPALSTILTVS
jgi:hypothetical protein